MMNLGVYKLLLRASSSSSNCLRSVHHLNAVKLNRSLLSLKGEETFPFLQGLISNDIRQFMKKFRLPYKQSIYSLLLQSNGRTLADFILYNTGKQIDYVQVGSGRSSSDFEVDSDQSVLLECDTNIKANLIKLLKVYKLKKKLELSEDNQLFVWCIYSPDCKEFTLKEYKDDTLIITPDPRLNHLGYRCLTNESDFQKLIDKLRSVNLISSEYFINQGKLQDYTHHRYQLGIGEGILDNPSGQCLPLEDNADLLNGLDFNKGCYLGQELVARTHYTGVVRKRLLPIEVIKFSNHKFTRESMDLDSELSSELKEKVKFGITLYGGDDETQPKKRLGKVRAVSSTSNLGLGLLYHKELDKFNHLAANHELGLLVKVNKPIWWPVIH